MKKIITCMLVCFSFSVSAHPNITLTLSDEMESGDTKICLYSNSNYQFTYEVDSSEHCPFTKTFSTEE